MARCWTKKLDCVDRMPPRRHKLPGKEFSWKDSEVMKWLINQPGILEHLFERARAHMVYDAETGMWRGRDYDG